MKRLVELARFPRESTRCDRERRSQTRYPLSISINGVPIDGQGKPTGLPLSLTLCDIAEAGAGLTTFDRLEAGLLLLQVVIPHEGVASLIGCVEWLKSVGKITRFGMSFPTEG
ncbi:hypothetical protein Pla111_10770 [Botrimarina hoheduenensis]|uniref:PilZ domain-containing protein n=2 Tax=Botrimarina hoheduenensis TaxID=2528000 RepID=A0A5C5WB40_9BACT|nr:hypothetical protein Pla111_10770 [Botrimarina hoheduenensis]